LAERNPTPEEARSMGEYVSIILEESPIGIGEIQQASERDELINSTIKRVLTSAWRDCSPAEEPYYRIRDQLTVVNGILLFGNRYVIPEAIRHSVLRLAHEGHPGMDAFLETLRARVWWPGLTKDATVFVERCGVSWRKLTNHAQILQPSEIEGVWEKLAVDLVTIEGTSCLSIVDYGSRYPEVLPLVSSTTTAVTEKLLEAFARFGLPSTLVSDNGPPIRFGRNGKVSTAAGDSSRQIQPPLSTIQRDGREVASSFEGAFGRPTSFNPLFSPFATGFDGYSELATPHAGYHAQ
jgi:hypothetical protein